jgi:hypothetical protein
VKVQIIGPSPPTPLCWASFGVYHTQQRVLIILPSPPMPLEKRTVHLAKLGCKRSRRRIRSSNIPYSIAAFRNVRDHALAGELHDGAPDSIEYWWMLELSFAQVYCHPNISLCITQHCNYESVNYSCKST